jgi:sodium/hydrogen exchanger 8
MCLISRACNIFPLSILLNYFREHKITKKMQFIMWFSGLRGAIAFALSLNLELDTEVRHVIVTTTLILVLFTTMILGGATLPLMKLLNSSEKTMSSKNNSNQKTKKFIFLSKTKELDNTTDPSSINNVESNDIYNLTGDDSDIHFVRSGVRLKGFARVDEIFLKPFLIRKFTEQVKEIFFFSISFFHKLIS